MTTSGIGVPAVAPQARVDPVCRRASAQHSGRAFCRCFRLLQFGLLLGFAGAPLHAKVGQAECLWRHIPAKVHVAAVEGYELEGKAALDSLPVSDDMVRAAMASCGVSGGRSEATQGIGGSLVGAALRDAAGQWLVKRGLSAERLRRAWLGTSSADRQAISREISPDPSGTSHADVMIAAFFRFAERAGAPPAGRWPRVPNPLYDAMRDYFQGQAQLAVYELRY